MAEMCSKCGAPMGEAEAFCMQCGAARQSAGQKRFCSQCGTPLEGVSKFCSKCGAQVDDSSAATTPVPAEASVASPSPVPPKPSVPAPGARPAVPPSVAATPVGLGAPSPSRKKGSPWVKILVAVLGFIALVVVLAIGSCFYIGYKVEQKAKQAVEEVKNGVGQDTGKPKYESRPITPCESNNRTGFDEFKTAASSASIPLKQGMTLTDIWPAPDLKQQDIEILHTVDQVTDDEVHISSKRLDGKNQVFSRNLCIADMIDARELETSFGRPMPQTISGATMFSLSHAEFDDLKAGRPSTISYYDAYKGWDNTFQLEGDNKGNLTRIEADDVPYSIIVNGDQKDLPTIHARAALTKYTYEAWVLDDAANPLILNMVRPSDKWHITYVKITFPVEKKIEQDLAKTGRAEIYGIYFDFNSATLRPESDPVLKEISDALKDNPAWKIKIDGHTDNIGGDAYNLKLSQRRAQAVMEALASRYGITADRMTPEGFGASRPKAPNDTVEGRALNRRVELVRE